ncbi:flavin-containing monooxygenase FMO GS-OX-like 2 isoform X1 [Octopus sinensis]|uniref:Flavin-containing monooxygenase n=1 Tax=Octopus sinensis TaxID=2607531 RepID=A0A7E6FFK1_9MOLL|nr:flavin-containing monooxygenase FMO GS-OX-like 2 isoform X1 [Octopus sinensis]
MTSNRTNLPKEVMAFPDFHFSQNLPSFITHTNVKDYLIDYANNFGLYAHSKLKTQIERVEMITTNTGSIKWCVTYKDVEDSSAPSTSETYDSVVVCNGHYSIPNIPEIPGLKQFEGSFLHSHDYRVPEVFKGKTVLCLGGGASGIDIAMDLTSQAKKVFLSHRGKQITSPLPENLEETVEIKSFSENFVNLKDGRDLEVDTVIFCTGYKYDFPFLTKECNLNITDGRVYPLFKHIVHAKHPSLNFIGVTKKVCPFPTFHCQVQFMMANLDGSMKLPSYEEMLQDIEKDYETRRNEGMPHRHTHTMVGRKQWDYNDDITSMAETRPISKQVRDLFDKIHYTRINNLLEYKKYNYYLKNDNYVGVQN